MAVESPLVVNMKVLRVYPTPEDTAAAAAQHVISRVQAKPDLHITYATGATMEPFLAHLAQAVASGQVDFSHTIATHLDEYYPVDPDTNPDSFVRFLKERAFTPLKIPARHIYTLDGRAPDPDAEAARYEQQLRQLGIDLAIVGTGENGHLAFCEPGTSFDSVTHLAQLAPETVERDRRRGQSTPDHALTQGIGTSLRAKEMMLIAYGEKKGQILQAALAPAQINPQIPIAALRMHENVSFYIDEAAAGPIRSAQKYTHYF